MAFGVTALKAFGTEAYQGNRKQFVQYLEMDITGLAADVILDIGDVGGTFWTSVGAPGAAKAKAVAEIFSRVDKHLSLSVPQLLAKTQVTSGATVATTQYKVASPQSTSFTITIFAGEGLTAYSLAMSWTLKPNRDPVTVTL